LFDQTIESAVFNRFADREARRRERNENIVKKPHQVRSHGLATCSHHQYENENYRHGGLTKDMVVDGGMKGGGEPTTDLNGVTSTTVAPNLGNTAVGFSSVNSVNYNKNAIDPLSKASIEVNVIPKEGDPQHYRTNLLLSPPSPPPRHQPSPKRPRLYCTILR
jgi:hypothetical protein